MQMNNIADIHTHILPKVDDGAASVREALQILEDEAEQGVTKIMLTPHFRKGMFEPKETEIGRQYRILLGEAKRQFPEMDIRLGCEFHAIPNMMGALGERKTGTLNQTKVLLLEFSGRHSVDYIKEKTEELLNGGYRPIIAHIERYPSVYKELSIIEGLRKKGALVQINADSVLGMDGYHVKRFCKKLLKKRFVDMVASDVHNMTTRTTHIGNCAEWIADKYGEEYAEALFVSNPGQLFQKN
jgi:protein-tyrosine phosphatase